ncbi:FecR domain-containing protein [Pendulispora albinea]|uniref:FecR domain-containing protein n=1 Tax=Pendulispora albinea TaxID=2741071 RepID=A0ABZ2M7H7_9BACT
MKSASCPRQFEVEAVRDGRLMGPERASFEAHRRGCPVCSREAQALDDLAGAFRASSPNAGADELRVRRERTRLLAAFDGALVAPEPTWRARPRRLGLAAALVLVAGLLVFWRMRHPSELRQAVPAPAPDTVIHADSTALYSKRTEGGRDEIVLERGALWIHVSHASPERALRVLLPDGELEDTGTIFTVSVADGHTTRVAVEEGSVVLRLRGAPPAVLGAGGIWVAADARATPPPSAPAPVPPSAPAPAPSSAGSTALATSASAAPLAPQVPRGPRVSPAPHVPSAPPSASAPRPDPSDDFRTAMAAFGAGKNREAASRFAAFLEKHPRDPRAEDAAYLRIFALQRTGDASAMKDAARAYLHRYPAGFRRAEVEELLR